MVWRSTVTIFDQQLEREGSNWIALDAGGTMTDAVIVDPDGRFLVGKYLTNKQDESISFIGSIADAAKTDGKQLSQVLPDSEVIVYAGTIMLNTLLSKTGSRVGLLLTQGFEDYLLMEKAEGGWLGYPTRTACTPSPTIMRSRSSRAAGCVARRSASTCSARSRCRCGRRTCGRRPANWSRRASRRSA